MGFITQSYWCFWVKAAVTLGRWHMTVWQAEKISSTLARCWEKKKSVRRRPLKVKCRVCPWKKGELPENWKQAKLMVMWPACVSSMSLHKRGSHFRLRFKYSHRSFEAPQKKVPTAAEQTQPALSDADRCRRPKSTTTAASHLYDLSFKRKKKTLIRLLTDGNWGHGLRQDRLC